MSARSVLGSTEPRLWTPPLRELTPDTSAGFAQARFAKNVLRHPLDPWEERLVIRAGELLPDGRPRFRIVLVLVARQNGKTEVLVILTLYWQFIEAVPLVLGTSTKLDYAKESWKKATALAERCGDPDILKLIPRPRWTRDANGEQESWTTEKSRYKIAASNEEGGRSLTVHKLVCDELRQHHDYSAWAAAEEATSAVWDTQIWALSNAGDARSVVLNDYRNAAIEFIQWWDENGTPGVAELLLAGESIPGMPGDHRLGIFEWSAPADADPCDIRALAMANPNLGPREAGRRKDPEVLLAKARRAVRLGGDALITFKTESMCINVPHLDPAVDTGAWGRGKDIGDLVGVRSRVATVVDVSPDQLHVTLAAAAVLADGRARVEIVRAWDGPAAPDRAARDLPALLARVRPQAFGWIPGGPAASMAVALADRRKAGRPGWPPPGVTVAEIKSEAAAVCMSFAGAVTAGLIAHSDDPLLNAHVTGSERLSRGDAWVFSRRGGHCDAAYAAAGAVFLARTLPAPVGKPRLIVAN